MRKHSTIVCCALLVLLCSCKDLFKTTNVDSVAHKITVLYDEAKADTRKEGGFDGNRPIASDGSYIYGFSIGSKEDPGLLIRVPTQGGASISINIWKTAIDKGYSDSTAYNPDEILSIVVDWKSERFLGQATASSTCSPFTNLMPASTRGMNLNPSSLRQHCSASLHSL